MLQENVAHRNAEPALTHFTGRGWKPLSCKFWHSGSHLANADRAGFPFCVGEAARSQRFHIPIALRLSNEVAASCLYFSQVNKHSYKEETY